MPTLPENELVCDANEAKKPKSKRKSTSPRKVIIEKKTFQMNHLNLKFLNTVIFSLNRYQTSQEPTIKKPRRRKEVREEQALRR